MKKLVLFFAVASALTFVSCSNTAKTETPEASTTEQTEQTQEPAPAANDTVKTDTTQVNQ